VVPNAGRHPKMHAPLPPPNILDDFSGSDCCIGSTVDISSDAIAIGASPITQKIKQVLSKFFNIRLSPKRRANTAVIYLVNPFPTN